MTHLKPSFPTTRMRRMRRDDWSRRLMAENTLTPSDLIWPVFVLEGQNQRQAIPSLPGVERMSADLLIEAVTEAKSLGVPAVALFPVVDPSLKTEDAREAYNEDNLVCRVTRALREAHPDIGIICDVALDPYTSHGQDGLMEDGHIVNDPTLDVLCKQSIALGYITYPWHASTLSM